mmetsp:Transcript_15304/g.35873  ORF Transcript_15304/g.35873 Transcript_15304/m.35873 type:complete len:253 (-) Transcript_15304:3909-4667(-)
MLTTTPLIFCRKVSSQKWWKSGWSLLIGCFAMVFLMETLRNSLLLQQTCCLRLKMTSLKRKTSTWTTTRTFVVTPSQKQALHRGSRAWGAGLQDLPPTAPRLVPELAHGLAQSIRTRAVTREAGKAPGVWVARLPKSADTPKPRDAHQRPRSVLEKKLMRRCQAVYTPITMKHCAESMLSEPGLVPVKLCTMPSAMRRTSQSGSSHRAWSWPTLARKSCPYWRKRIRQLLEMLPLARRPWATQEEGTARRYS